MKEKSLEIKKMYIKYDFTEEELHGMGPEIAKLTQEKAVLEREKKKAASKFKFDIESIDANIINISDDIRQGWTYKNADCYEIFDYKTRQVFTHRADTEKQVDVRTMKIEEFQRETFDPREAVEEKVVDAEFDKDTASEFDAELLKDEGENKPTEYLNDKPVE